MTKKQDSAPHDREQETIEGLKVVCKCRNVRRSVLLKHITAGVDTVEKMKKTTGAGSGTCKGKECTGRLRNC